MHTAKGGSHVPRLEIPAPPLTPHPFPAEPETEIFDQSTLSLHWQTLREPHRPDWLSLTARPGWLRLVGRESLNSRFDLSLIARRVEHLRLHAETWMEFSPATPWQMAGLTAYYGNDNYYFLAVSRGDDGLRRLLLIKHHNGAEDQLLPDDGLVLPETGGLRLAVDLDGAALRFSYALSPDTPLLPVGGEQDAGILSDEEANFCFGSFTGAFLGLAACDLSGARASADFRSFTYRHA